MMNFSPEKRASARDCLKKKWLKKPNFEIFKYTPIELEKYLIKKNLLSYENVENFCEEANDSDNFYGDIEDNNKFELNRFRDESESYCEEINFKLLERSFIDVGYVGYGDGIFLEELDKKPNKQFEKYF